jgi:branched-chain amino acid transport system substrate-binding protein
MAKTQKTIWWVVGIVVVVGLIVWGVSKNKGSGNTIKIGWIGPLTGDVSSIGTVNKAAVQVAVDEVNATGGVNGKQIQMFYEDAQCNAQLAVSAAQKLISINGVSIIISECSTETSAFGPMAMQNKVIVFSPVSSAPSLSQLGKYFFRDYPSDSFAGKFEADYAYNKLGARKVAILYHISDYGTGLKDVFTQEFQNLGGTIVDVEGASQTATDYRTALSKIKGLNPDLIYSPMYPDGATIALTQASQLGMKTKFLDSDAFDDPNLEKAVSGKGTFLFAIPATASLPQDLQKKISAITGGTDMPAGTGPSYDAIKIIAAAIIKTGTNPDRLADAIRATQYDGVSGHIAFDQNGDLTTVAYTVEQIKNGGAVVISQ